MMLPLRLFSSITGMAVAQSTDTLSLLQLAVRARREPADAQASWANILATGAEVHEAALLAQGNPDIVLADASPDIPIESEDHPMQVMPVKGPEPQYTRIAVKRQGDALEVFSHPEPSRLELHVEGSPRGFGLKWRGSHCEIEHVLPGSLADSAGLRAGDFVQAIGGQTVASFDDVMRLLPRTGALDITVARMDATILRGDIKNKSLPRGRSQEVATGPTEEVASMNDTLTAVNNALASVPEVLVAEVPQPEQSTEALHSAKFADIESDVSGDVRGFSIRWENDEAIVDGLDHDGPAEKAGLVIGDVLMSINGEPIKVAEDVARLIPKEDDFKIHVLRKHPEPVSLTETSLQGAEHSQDQGGAFDLLLAGEPRGFTVNWDAKHGAVVDKVQANSPAYRSGVRSGDVVVAVDNFTIHSLEDLARFVPSNGEFDLWIRHGLSRQ